MNTTVMHTLRVLFGALVGAVAVFFYVGIRYGEPPWMQEPALLQLGLGLAIAYVIGFVLVKSPILTADTLFARAVRVIAIASLVCLPAAIMIPLTGIQVQKLTLLIEIGLVFFLISINGIGLPGWLALSISIVVLVVGLQPAFTAPARASLVDVLTGGTNQDDAAVYALGSLHDIRTVSTQVTPNPEDSDPGGALEAIDRSHLLLVDAHGIFYLLRVDGGTVASSPLKSLRSPMNRDAYVKGVKRPSNFFAVTDMLLVDDGVAGQRTVYLAYHHWDEREKCVTLNVDEAHLKLDSLDSSLEWTNRFKTNPCISGERRLTNETGGRLALGSKDTLLLTVGITIDDAQFWDVSTIDTVSYGKILELNRVDWSSAVFSKGHRNPQGLLVEEGKIWSTEHGPDGGDELNLIVRGGDYGWPRSSYGTDYGRKTLKGSDTPGEHATGLRPVYAWVPSIGISRLIRASGTGFPGWRGDLLIASLSGRGTGHAIYRVRMHDDEVKLVERIQMGFRVRDLIEMPDGQIVTWDGSNMAQTLTSASHVFAECSSCHALNQGWPNNGIGPDLLGIVGSAVADVEGFNYSPAMRQLGGRWTRERLDWFLRDPQAAVPGTNMMVPGIEDRGQRRAIIEFLRRSERTPENQGAP